MMTVAPAVKPYENEPNSRVLVIKGLFRTSLFALIMAMSLGSQGQNNSLSLWQKTKNRAARFLNDSAEADKPRLLLYPTLAFSPETSLEIGVSALFLYYAKNNPERNRLSEVQMFSFYTLNNQYGAWFDHFLYSDHDRWFFLGRLRFHRFPILYYGVGIDAPAENPTVLYSDYTLIKERVLRKVANHFFVGLEFDYQRLYNVQFERDNDNLLLRGANGTSNFGVGLGLVYDNRHNPLNVRKGFFSEIAWIDYSRTLGSEYSFRSIITDNRIFRTVRPKQVLAAQVYGAFMQGNVPFNQLALVGGESLMRGYYLGRFRDRNYIAAQVEYRWLPLPFSKRWGATAFAAMGTVSNTPESLFQKKWLPTGGAGVRFLVFPKKDIFIRADVAITREGPNFYIYTGEAF